MDLMGAETGGVGSGSLVTRPLDRAPICQNLIDLSLDNKTMEEENAREVMGLACPVNTPAMQAPEQVIYQIWMVQPIPPATRFPSGEKAQHRNVLLVT